MGELGQLDCPKLRIGRSIVGALGGGPPQAEVQATGLSDRFLLAARSREGSV